MFVSRRKVKLQNFRYLRLDCSDGSLENTLVEDPSLLGCCALSSVYE
jgi:hypothetical protein